MINDKKRTVGVVIGLGSMGKRRVRDLKALGVKLYGYDIREDRCKEVENLFDIQTVQNLIQVTDLKPDFIVISTPPDTHYELYKFCFEQKIHFFSEANILTPAVSWFEKNELESTVYGIPSGSWRFHPSFLQLRKLINGMSLEINSIHLNYSEFLPDWHPWEEYDQFYAGQEKTYAAREMVPFEFDALTFLVGRIKKVNCVTGRTYPWKTKINDYYHIHFESETGIIGTLNIELSSIIPSRKLTISCYKKYYFLETSSDSSKTTQGSIAEYSIENNTWKYHFPETMRIKGGFDFEEMYTNEIKAFLLFIRNESKNYPKTWKDDRHLSDILYACELSNVEGKWVNIEDISDNYTGRKL